MRTNKPVEKSTIEEPSLNQNEPKIYRIYKLVRYFIEKISDDKISIYSAQASFFMLLSIFPLIMLLLNIISHTSLPESLIPSIINYFAPNSVRPFLLQIVAELQTKTSGAAISITALIAIWSASKGALAIILGMREILDASKDKNYFVLRFYSIIYIILLLLSLVLTLVLLVFGNSIFGHFIDSHPIPYIMQPLYTFGRYTIAMIILTIFFVSMYKMGGNKRYKFMDLLPGAMFTSLSWMIFSYIFSIYIDNFSNFSYMYGSLTAVIIIMLWMYFCMYIMFVGAEINEYMFDHK